MISYKAKCMLSIDINLCLARDTKRITILHIINHNVVITWQFYTVTYSMLGILSFILTPSIPLQEIGQMC